MAEEPNGPKLEFSLDQNPYFKSTVLTKIMGFLSLSSNCKSQGKREGGSESSDCFFSF